MNLTRLSNQAVIGFIIIAVGILFLLDTTNVYNTGSIFRWIPSLFILFGLWKLIANRFRNLIGPIIIIAVAAFIQAIMLGIDIGSLWPAILIIIGIALLVGRSRRRNHDNTAELNMVDSLGIFGSTSTVISSQSFKGGQIAALMGGVKLDLRKAEVSQKPAIIEATVIMGGAEIIVPEHWVVKTDSFAIFAGTEDKRYGSANVIDDTPDLVITGLVIFGGVEIKD